MFCGKCGNQIDDNATFCPACGNPVVPKNNNANTSSYNYTDTSNFTSPMPPQPPKKNGKKIALIVTIAILVISAIVTTVCLILSSNGGGSTSDYGKDRGSKRNDDDNNRSDDYIEEIEDYLNFVKNKEDDADKYIEDTYFGGAFGYYYSGEDADYAHKLETKTIFENGKESEMDYGYAEYYDYDSWEEYIEASDIDEFYDYMDDVYGEWDMTYKITDTKKCSNEKLDSLKDVWDECIVAYDDFSESEDFSKNDQREYDSFIDSIRDFNVSEAYSIEVKIEFDGEEDSYDNVWSFSVAKIGKEWVILEGPSFYEFYEIY
ncbi:MAG: zinc-ribbon domain-containing protein [Ruminococcaceae bacterium]|nr:zinc-ribbon domain-containing protein [Oscillospiraceae bacterium]